MANRKKTESAVSETIVEKTETVETNAVKKAPAKRTVKAKATAVVQYAGEEFDVDALVEAAKADFKAQNSEAIKDIKVYIKPEDRAAYYVVNDGIEGKVEF